MEKVRTRFAPSPTGYLHLGGLRTALYGYLYAKQRGGDFILRIEDTDQNRYVEGAVELIYESMNDAGIHYDEGPDVGGDYGPYIQSERKQLYKEYAEKLVELGGAYYCFCSKERLDSLKDENGIAKYDKHCLSLSKEEVEKRIADGEPYVIRQNVPSHGVGSYVDMVFGEIEVDYKDIEDGILLKSDGMPTYNFANVIDDHLMGITHVIRGCEYLSSTPKYNLMYDAFGWQRPAYIHLQPIMRDARNKLSKRYGAAYYGDFVEKGYIKEAIVNYIALLGWSPKENIEKMDMKYMIENFSLDGISKSPSIFDEAKLRWLSGEYIKAMTDEEVLPLAMPFIEKSKIYDKGYDYSLVVKLLRTRIEILSEIPEKIDFIEEYGEFSNDLYYHKKSKCDASVAKVILPKVLEVFEKLDDFSNSALFETLKALAEREGVKANQVMWCVRVAVSGRETTPGGATELCELLGKDRTLERIRFAIDHI